MIFQLKLNANESIATLLDKRYFIDFEPSYQRRGNIWKVPTRQYLIDTVINGFDIPKFYLADFTLLDSDLNPKRFKYAIIDGKQRILALIDFIENRLPLSENFIFFQDPHVKLSGLYYDDLIERYPSIAKIFDTYLLSIVSVVTDDEHKINELFVRLNAGKSLNGAEVRNAMPGIVPRLIRELTEHPFWSRIKFDTSRSQDKNTAAKLLLIEQKNDFTDTKKRQLDNFVEQAARRTPANDRILDTNSEDESIKILESSDQVKAVLNDMAQIFMDKDRLLANESQIPIIYWLVRECERRHHPQVRPFLLKFDQDRQANRKRQAEDPLWNKILVEYELMARTSNDQASLRGRYDIVRQQFDDFLETQNTSESPRT
jgi:hypothetical protein